MGRWMAGTLAAAGLVLVACAQPEPAPDTPGATKAEARPAEPPGASDKADAEPDEKQATGEDAEKGGTEASAEKDDKAEKGQDGEKADKPDDKKPTVIVQSEHRRDGRLPFLSYGRLAPEKSQHDIMPLPQRVLTITDAAVACGDGPTPEARLELTGPAPDDAPAPTRSAALASEAARRVYSRAPGEAGFETAQAALVLAPAPAPTEPCIVTLTGRVERDLRPPETSGEAAATKKDDD